MQLTEIENAIKQEFNCKEVKASSDDGHHFEVLVVSDDFREKSLVVQHQMVYRALGQERLAEIHALSITTRCP